MGLAASMGQFLLCAGAKGKRYALPHARIMMHQPSGGIGGTASDIEIQAEQMLYIKAQMAELIAQHTGQPLEQIESDSDRDRWFTAEEAKDYGFIDHVVRQRRPGRRTGTPELRPSPAPVSLGGDEPMNYLQTPAAATSCPVIEERTSYGMQRDQPLHQAVRGPHHLPRHADRRRVANDVMAQLLRLESMDPDRDISIYINSPGGSFTALTAIYDTMRYIKPDIQTVCLGQAASAAAVLLAAGTPGKRLALPNSRVLIHQPSTEGGGQACDIEIQANEILRMRA